VNRRELILGFAALAAVGGAGASPSPTLPLANDLRADGRAAASRRVPLVVLFSLAGCPYCDVVRRSYLAPMLRDERQASRVLVRQVDLGASEPLVDFAGKRTTHGEFARARGVRVAPVVSFWDESGRTIAASLEGMLLPDFYGAYLDGALETAEKALRERR
jgi:thioredoxin-related protein